MLQGIAHNPIEIDGKTIDPAKEPELFLRSLYLTVSERPDVMDFSR